MLTSFFQWIPICRNGSLQTGLFELPVMLDPPSIDLRRLPTDQAPSGTKWVDNKKNIFSVELIPATTVHPLDNYIDPFLQLTVINKLKNIINSKKIEIKISKSP